MKCPACKRKMIAENTRLLVTHTHRMDDQHVKRYRKCVHCGHRTITIEMPMIEYQKWTGELEWDE